MTNKKSFNLIEILISMIVIIFAMFIILSFLPLAQKQSQAAHMSSQVSNFSENFLSYLKQQKSTEIINTFPFVENSTSSNYETSISSVTTNSFQYDKLSDNTGIDETEGWLTSNNSYLHPHKSQDGFFKITKATTINNVLVKDTEIELRSWRTSPTVRSSSNDTPNTAIASDHFDNLSNYKSSNDSDIIPFTTRIHLEFSWPLNRSYSKREKFYTFYDIHIL